MPLVWKAQKLRVHAYQILPSVTDASVDGNIGQRIYSKKKTSQGL